MPWTAYHDGLNQEAIALMTEPGWYNVPAIQDRLTAIRTELGAAGADMAAGQDQRMKDLLTKFQSTYDQTQTANENRYADILSKYGSRQTQGMTRLDAVTTGAQNLANTQNTMWNSRGGIVTGWQDRTNQLSTLFNGLGDRARQDVRDTYTAQRSQADQGLQSRGLGNTTVRNSVMGGIANQENADLGRVNEQLRSQQIGMQSQWTQDALNARQQGAMMNFQSGQLPLQFQSQAAQGYIGMSADPMGVMERRTDVGPSLADIANLSMQLGRGTGQMSTLGGFVPTMMFRGGGGNAMSAGMSGA